MVNGDLRCAFAVRRFFPRNMVLGCIQDNRLIYEYGREMARQCRELGVQVNFAPVADVNVNPKNPVINNRSFGEDPVRVADKVIAYATGLEGGGVLSVCKSLSGTWRYGRRLS